MGHIISSDDDENRERGGSKVSLLHVLRCVRIGCLGTAKTVPEICASLVV
jgi:hypothetical protein